MTAACAAPLPWADLVDYWSGDLEAREAERVEEHAFACGACAARLERVAALAGAVRSHGASLRVSGVTTLALLERLEAEGLTIRRYHLSSGEAVNCTAGAGDDYVAIELQTERPATGRVDVIVREGGAERRVTDVPGGASRLVMMEPGEELRRMPAGIMDLTVVDVGPSGEHPIGVYRLNHIPFKG